MAAHETQSSPKASGIQKIGRVLSDGYYGATYIPDQEDPLGVAVTEAVRHGPFFLALRDLWTCVRMFTLFPGVVMPFRTTNPQDEMYSWGPNLIGLILLSIASVFEVTIILLCVPIFILLPGPISIAFFVCGQTLIHIICIPLQGPSKVWSKTPTDPVEIAKHEKNADQRWFFLNGCCVSGLNLQNNVDQLSETFGRPIFAIHNRTYGILGDLFECILQRSFDLFTEETRVCYEYIKSYCTDPQVNKVVLIAHSQGCIMASQILDQLYVDLPAEACARLEVYTFGNAAAHFNNPLRRLSQASATVDARDIQPDSKVVTFGQRNSQAVPDSRMDRKPTVSTMLPERVIPYIEHYCNSQDMVTRWGALFSAKSILENRFCGHIFINEGASGHMLNQHYLSDMFPLRERKAGAGHAVGTSSDAKHGGVPFLDRVVHVDTATITQRNSTAIHQLAVMRHDSAPLDRSDHAHVAHNAEIDHLHESSSKEERDKLALTLGEGKRLTLQDMSGAEGSRISVVRMPSEKITEATGKTVRQLSRLWRYLGGADPDEDKI
ncbi:hypothetical protein BX600DRAFT_498163 [Xylariales sp. PMI_506]|nr:hypothetical protein BX600DRAFT_498163 [Xylariales sp. PMI_506]